LFPEQPADERWYFRQGRDSLESAHNRFGHFCLAWKTAMTSRRSARSL
jgi:hypothetical protein